MNRVLSIVALLMLTLGAWAEQTVNVVVMPNANAGTVTCSLSNNKYTLTVTPAEGYTVLKSSVRAVAMLAGEAMQAPRRSIDLDEGTELAIEADANDATKFYFTKPADDFNVAVMVEFYGGISFDPATNTLTLDHVNIRNGEQWAFEYDENISYLHVRLLGDNTIAGNAFKFGTGKPALVFMTDPITPGSLTVTLPYSLVSPEEGDNGTTVYYENGLQRQDVQYFKVSGTPINLTVGGVQVTSQNMTDILGDGKVSFDADSKRLTLNGATIDMSQKKDYPVESDIPDLEVRLKGFNTIKRSPYKQSAFCYTPTAATGKLTFTHEEYPDNDGFGFLKIEVPLLATNYKVVNDFLEVQGNTGWYKTEIENIYISYVEYYDLLVDGIPVNSSELTCMDGQVIFNPITNTLSLDNYATSGGIMSGLEDLTVSLTGANTVGAIAYGGAGTNGGTLTICKTGNSTADVNKLSASSITGFSKVTVDDPLHVVQPDETPVDWATATNVVISDAKTYKLWVNGTLVTSENKDAVTTGVSFDGDHTLTLNNVDISKLKSPFITNGLNKLTIHLLGTNTVDCSESSFLAKKDGDGDHLVTFTTDVNAVGKLTVSNAGDDWLTGHTSTYQNGLALASSQSTITIEAPSADYQLTIGGIAVTNQNATDVLGNGQVSFDAKHKMLTLNNAIITGGIVSSMEKLFVSLNGSSTMTGGFTLGTGCNSAELIFTAKGVNADDKLTMNAAFASGFNITYYDRLQLDGLVVKLPDNYGITVADVSVTPVNRTNIYGTNIMAGSVIFDNNNQLILKNATINGEIVVADAASMSENTLTLFLEGQNTINLDNSQNAVKCTNGNLKLVFAMDKNNPGSLAINGPSNYVTDNHVFSDNITVDLSSLKKEVSENQDKMTIATYLKPIVNGTGQTAEIDFSILPPSTSTNGSYIGGALINLGSETDDKENTSGFDNISGKLVFAEDAAMDPETVASITDEPGTPEFAQKFKGVSILLPAGLTTVLFSNVNYPSPMYVFVFRCGQFVKEVPSGTSSIYVVNSKAETAQIYLIEKKSNAPQMASHRIGPKSSVAGALGGIKVTSNSMQASQAPAITYKMMEASSMAASLASMGDARNGYSCSDPDITDLPDDAFLTDGGSSSAPRRAGKMSILPEGLPYIDFSGTKITGKEISRKSGIFNGVPENVFIYMPAGNTTTEKNVVIGSICDIMELEGANNAQPFKVRKDFSVGQATLKRTFSEGSDNYKATVCLPFALSESMTAQFGMFYEYSGFNGETVNMTSVTSTAANTPYIFQAKAADTNISVNAVNVVAGGAGGSDFQGVYERTDYNGADNWYCYSDEGKFVRMKSGAYVPPFRAFLAWSGVTSAPSLSILWDGKEDVTESEQTTAMEAVKTVADKKAIEGWWTLNGLRLTALPKTAGLYVKDGKLVVIK